MHPRPTPMHDELSSDLASLRIARDAPPPPGPWRKRAVAAAVIAALLGAGAFGLTSARDRIFKAEVSVTQIRLVSPAQASVQVTAAGYVVPQVTSKVTAGLLARIAEVRVREGQLVKKGDVLARLEDAEARSRLAAARAKTAQARAQLAEVKARYEREQALSQSGVTARAVAEDLGLQVATLEESAKAAQAEADALAAVLRHATIVSPMDGVVTGKPAGVGELVGPSMEGAVVELADFSTLVVETDVPEGRLHQIQVGGPGEIVLDAYPSRRLRGRVLEVSPRVNRAKATVVVKVAFVDEASGVLPEMAARVSFLAQELSAEEMKAPPKLFLPGSAVVRSDGRTSVFRVDEGKARKVAVELGPPMENGFELVSGPGDGTRVVADPPDFLQDGQSIKEKSP